MGGGNSRRDEDYNSNTQKGSGRYNDDKRRGDDRKGGDRGGKKEAVY